MKINNKNNKRGLALPELMLGLVVVGGFLMGIYQTYATVSYNQKIDQEGKALQTIQGMVRSIYSTEADFAGLENVMLTNNRSFPGSMRGKNAGEIRNSWISTGVKVAPLEKANAKIGRPGATTDWEADDKYFIEYPNVPSDACFDLVSKVTGYFEEVRVGSNDNSKAIYSKPAASKECSASPVVTLYMIGGK